MSNDELWTDGSMHPDLFDGETPIREKIDLNESGLRVYRVECTYYVQEEETHFIVAHDPEYAEDLAWEKIHEEPSGMDSAEVAEMNLDDVCSTGDNPTARALLEDHIKRRMDVR